jgi:hemolysin activation/secretion protein
MAAAMDPNVGAGMQGAERVTSGRTAPRFRRAGSGPRRRMRATLLQALAGLVFATAALAQAPSLPSTIQPGRIEERVEPRRVPPRPPRLPEMREGEPEPIPEGVRALKVVLKEVRFVGATAVPVERLQELAAPYVGREITGAQIFDLARVLTAAYRNAGFILSQVIVPPQTLAEGVLTLRVIEGYVAEVRVEGDPVAAETLAALGEKIKMSRPLSAAVLERYLLIANDLPGVQVRSVLSPSKALGAADLTLIATVKHFDGFGALDNYGSRYLGPGQASVGATGYQLLGANERWRLIGAAAGGDRELVFGQFSYAQMLGTEGFKLEAAVSRERTRPGDVLEVYEIRGRADAATLTLGYPLLRARNQSLFVRGLLDARNVYGDTLGTRLTEDRIRAVRAGATWIALDPLGGQNSLDVVYSRGVDGTSADDPLRSRLGADGRFGKASFDYARYQLLGASTALTLGAGGQWTDEPLLSSEQYALGGRRFGRAYEPAELVGDRALAFSVESAFLGRSSVEWLPTYQLLAFYDVGKVWYVDSGASATASSQSLASAGIGVRATLGAHLSATLEIAWPLTKPVASDRENGKDPRLLASLVAWF